jgi:hypothetical protein
MMNYKSFYLSTSLNGEKTFLFLLQKSRKTGSIYINKKCIFMNEWIETNE